jgi:alginate O-acetyltransferase complex protein AlgI
MLANLWITMLLAGLWHGASWTFVLWGVYHAALLTIYRWVPPLRNISESKDGSAWRIPASVALMFPLTLAGWAIFRSHDPGQLHHWLAALGNWSATAPADWRKPAGWFLLHAAPLVLLQLAAWRHRDEAEIAHLPWAARGVIYLALFLGITTTLSLNYEFIYFQF